MSFAAQSDSACAGVHVCLSFACPAQYKPRRGDALLFYSLHHNGTVDGRALHGGCPVRKGEKWVATKWIRDKCFMC